LPYNGCVSVILVEEHPAATVMAKTPRTIPVRDFMIDLHVIG
jgi:hypothetical protein